MPGATEPTDVRRRLSDDEIRSYDHIDASLARRVLIVGIPRVPGPYVGITLGRFVVLAADEPSDGSSALIAHELVHVRQWAQLGSMRFTWRYLADFARNVVSERSWQAAYRSIGAEIEARDEATRWAERHFRNTER
jgi:hypothetical protein